MVAMLLLAALAAVAMGATTYKEEDSVLVLTECVAAAPLSARLHQAGGAHPTLCPSPPPYPSPHRPPPPPQRHL